MTDSYDVDPSVDPAKIAAMLPSRQNRAGEALRALQAHFSRTNGYVAWSGGKDSTVAVHLARKVNPNVPVVWFDSGLEYPETREYVERLAASWDLNFTIISAEPDALTMLERSGGWHHGEHAPGASVRDSFHEVLVAEPSRKAHALFGAGEVLGLRMGESVGRRILLSKSRGRYERKDGTHVVAPIWRWSDLEVNAYFPSEGIEPNPVYEKLRRLGAPVYAQRVGLVVDYNGAEVGRFTWLKNGWPGLWASLTERLPRLMEWR